MLAIRRWERTDKELTKLRAAVTKTHEAWCAAVLALGEYERFGSPPMPNVTVTQRCQGCRNALPADRKGKGFCRASCRALKRERENQFVYRGQSA